jgi:hypothetical protein
MSPFSPPYTGPAAVSVLSSFFGKISSAGGPARSPLRLDGSFV